MNTSVQARRPAARLILRILLIVAMLPVSGLLMIEPAQAAYVNRLSTITNGAITFTGNTLGLSKNPTANAPGTSDAIGAFISTNTTLRDGTYPFGTTANWQQNSSAATLSIPAGSTVLHAELIWSGSYSYGGENVLAFVNTPVSFTTPGPNGGTFQIAPDPATSNILGTPTAAGDCPSDPVPSPPATTPCFYVRSADVTARVQAAGAGAYVVGGVPATQGTSDLYHNNAGWTLAVAYRNPNLPARSLTLFVGEEVTNSATTTNQQNQVTISGFCTPPNGQLSGRLLVSATEGDANRVGDQMQFGQTAATLQPVSGPNNPINNFFASQINNDTGALDTSGTFGTRNQNAAGTTNISGGRQGWDISNVDASARLVNGQTSAVVWGTSSGDQYVINALGTQIDIQAPAFRPDTKTVNKAVTFVGDTLTYSVIVENIGTANADNVVFFDPAPTGTSFIANTFTINGAAQAGADPNVGVNLGTVAPGPANARTITFQVRVNSVPPSFQFDNRARWTYDYQLCSGANRLASEVITNQVTTQIATLQSSKSVTPIGPVAAGQVLTYEIRSTNAGSAPTANTTLQDSIPAGTTYIAGSTTLNGTAVPDLAGPTMPFTAARTISSPGAPAGQIAAGATAIVRFQVRVNAGVTAQITNVATIDQDGPNGTIPPGTVQTFNPVVDLAATKAAALAIDTAPLGGSPGDTIEYTIAITNRGTGPATNATFSDNIPANSTYVLGSTTLNGTTVPDAAGGTMPFVGGRAINGPGAPAGQIAAGAVATIRFRVVVVSPLPTGVTQIVNQGVVSSNEVPPVPTDDPNTGPGGDPTITPVSAVPVISADKASALLTDADNNGVVSPGDTLRYTIVIANTGNTAATNVVYTDTPDTNTTLVPNTVTTTQGTITSGSAGTPPVTVNIGTLPAPAGKVTITYDARIPNPLPAGVTEAVNQGIVTSKEVPAVRTNDPNTLPPGDPTRVPIVANPVLAADKNAMLLIDADQNGGASPGDTLLYEITITNKGNAPATGVIYNDTPDANTTLVPNSVQTSTGSVTNGNTGTPPVTVNIGTIPGGGVDVTISYKVTINNPLSNPNAKEIVNQGVVSSNEVPPVPTNYPPTPPCCDRTVVPLQLDPRVSASKEGTLFTDADKNGRVSPGDTLLYQITIQNSGNGAATNAQYDDIPDSNTTLVIGSVQTSLGTVTRGNAAGDKSIGVAIGTIPPGGSLTISYKATILNPLPNPTATEIVNQGLVTGGFPSVPTDDRKTPQPDDPTKIPLTLVPVLIADKSASLLVDADQSGSISAGDTLQYTVLIQNIGNRPATAVRYVDTPDANTTLVVGSVATSRGSVTGGNTGVPPIVIDIGTLPNGADATIVYQVTINKPLPASVTEIVNQGVVRSPDTPDVPTNDRKTPPPGDPTRVSVVPTPILTADKTDFLFIDTNKSGKAGAGDTLLYVIEIANRGNVAAPNVTFTDTPDTQSTLVTGTVKTSQGTVTKGNTAGDTNLAVNIGTISAGDSVRISFQVRLKDQLTRQFIDNQGSATGTGIPPVPTNDPDTPPPGDPTRTIIPPGEATSVVLVSFTATRQSNGVMVRWVTSAEFNTWGFYLYRSADGDRRHAVRVTPSLIPGQGRGANSQSQYSWLDNTVLSDTIYSYWLQEVEINGTTSEYGPTRAAIAPAANHVIYLSLVTR